MLTQSQTDKITNALSVLYADVDFINVKDFEVAVTSALPVPLEVDKLNISKPTV